MNTFVRWPDKTLPAAISFKPGVLTGLEMAAGEGLMAMPKGPGLGIGGLLIGCRDEGRIEIHKALAIHCSHSEGPGFVLTADEVEVAGKHGENAAAEDEESEVVGWYCSRAPGHSLSEQDRAMFDALCPDEWQTAFVLWPSRTNPTTGAFGFRQAGPGGGFLLGETKELAWQELSAFEQKPLVGRTNLKAVERSPAPTSGNVKPKPAATAVAHTAPPALQTNRPPVPKPQVTAESRSIAAPVPVPAFAVAAAPRGPRRIRRIVLLSLALITLIGLLATAFFVTRRAWIPPTEVNLGAFADSTGRVWLLWNPEGVAGVQIPATLVVTDSSGKPKNNHLSEKELAGGMFEVDCQPGAVTASFIATIGKGSLSDSATTRVPAPESPQLDGIEISK